MTKVWMLTWGGEGMRTEIHLWREENPPSTDRIQRVLFDLARNGSNYGEDTLERLRDSATYDWEHSKKLAEAISKDGHWTDPSQYEGAELTLTEVE